MRVLMLSGDAHMLKEGTDASRRLALQRSQVELVDVFVWPQMHGLWQLIRAVRGNRYDVITAQDPFWRGHLAWHLAALCGARLNIQVHTDLLAYQWWLRAWARFHLRRADSVRVVSEKIQEQVKAMDITAPIHILPIFIDISRFRNLARQPHEKKTILWMGRFEAEKDPFAAITILKEVRGRNVDAKLVMLGGGSMKQALRERTEGLPIEFPGWQDPMLYLAGADVVISTSRHESYGASIIEALAAGVAVVSLDIGIAKEAGALIAPRQRLAEKVAEVLQNGARGELKLVLPSAQEWAKQWQKTL